MFTLYTTYQHSQVFKDVVLVGNPTTATARKIIMEIRIAVMRLFYNILIFSRILECLNVRLLV